LRVCRNFSYCLRNLFRAWLLWQPLVIIPKA
jgi:hypothetical protein